MNLPTRLGFWGASWLLWACAALYRLTGWLESDYPKEDSEAAWAFLSVLVGTVVAYSMWRGWLAVSGEEWRWGWRD